MPHPARVLSIAGSDSSGGAGIQADIKTITTLGAYALTALTAITVQDTTRVHQVHPLSPALVAAQIACALKDPGADAIKTGMLTDAPTIQAVTSTLATHAPNLPLVVDPVMVATSGDRLLSPDAIDALRALIPHATLITPNAPEAAALAGHPVTCLHEMRKAAQTLLAQGAQAVLVKGGHLDGETLTDLLVTPTAEHLHTHQAIHPPGRASRALHGTGCTLSAAIATHLAQHLPLPEAVARAIAHLQSAIAASPPFGAAALLHHEIDRKS